MSRRIKGPIEPGRVRRTSPNTCSVMPFPGSTVDELEQLRWLAQHYARHVPYGLDWPLDFWSERIGFHGEDHAAHCWLKGYFKRNTDPAVAAGNETRH